MKLKYIVISTALLLLNSCGNTESTPVIEKATIVSDTLVNEIMENQSSYTPLGDELNAKKEKFEEKATPEKKKIYAEGLQSVENDKIVENALQVGDIAVNFTLPNATGNTVTLYDELKNGPVILMWYRGGWCPYCNISLHYMQEALPEFKKYGANLLAISPEVPDSSITTKEKNSLEFEVLSDVGNVIAYQYKVVFKLTNDVANSYENGFGLSEYNGNSKGELPLAATYIIGQDKEIKYAFLDADYRNRAEPNELIEFLKKM